MPRGRPTRAVPNPRLVTLTTDIGWAYAAQMKAVLYRALPPGSVVDLTHDIPAHSVREGAFLLERMARGFPAGTVHVAIVDPGVGTHRAPIAIGCADGSVLVGPDNGVLAPLARSLGPGRAVRLDPERIVPGSIPSATFEGRDLFAPAAALVATGTRPEDLGPPFAARDLELPRPHRGSASLLGEILHVDRFGNLITNLPSDWCPLGSGPFPLELEGKRIRGVLRARTYAELSSREVGVIGSSFDLLEVAVREGSAAVRLRARVGQSVAIFPAARAGPRRGTPKKGPV
jgi:S-adenosyl-L-methionine hydrolase (adenosine-forming)